MGALSRHARPLYITMGSPCPLNSKLEQYIPHQEKHRITSPQNYQSSIPKLWLNAGFHQNFTQRKQPRMQHKQTITWQGSMQYFGMRRLKRDIYFKKYLPERFRPLNRPIHCVWVCASVCTCVSGVELASSWTGEQQTGNKTARCAYGPETHDPPWVTSCTVWLIPSALHMDGPQQRALSTCLLANSMMKLLFANAQKAWANTWMHDCTCMRRLDQETQKIWRRQRR